MPTIVKVVERFADDGPRNVKLNVNKSCWDFTTFALAEDYDFAASILDSLRRNTALVPPAVVNHSLTNSQWCIFVNNIRTYFNDKYYDSRPPACMWSDSNHVS